MGHNGTDGFYDAVKCPKAADRIENSAGHDKTATGAASSGFTLLAQTYLSQYLKLLRCLPGSFCLCLC